MHFNSEFQPVRHAEEFLNILVTTILEYNDASITYSPVFTCKTGNIISYTTFDTSDQRKLEGYKSHMALTTGRYQVLS